MVLSKLSKRWYFKVIGIVSLNLMVNALYAKDTMRIIALSPHSVELLYSIGAGDRIVATVEHADYPKAALKIPRIGNYTGIQIERVLELKPDLIVAWKSGNKKADLEKLKSLGLNIFYTQPKNIGQIEGDLMALGIKTGLQENAKNVISSLNKKYNKIKQIYANKVKVKVFYQLWHDPLRSVGSSVWIESLINDCNGENIFHDSETSYPVVSLESVLVKNPKVIIIPHHSGNEGAHSEMWANWPEISAVKENKVFILNGDVLHRFSPRALDGLNILCEKIDQGREIIQ